MKNSTKLRVIISFSFMVILCSCDYLLQKDCPDYLDPEFRKIVYKNNQIINFINDSGRIRNDTIKLSYYPVESTYVHDGGDNEHMKCGGSFSVTVGKAMLYNKVYLIIFVLWKKNSYNTLRRLIQISKSS